MTLISTGLANIIIGGATHRRAALPIIAEATSSAAGFRAYMIDNDPPGYSGGNGGSIDVALCIAENGVPGEAIGIGLRVPDAQFPSPSSGRGGFHLWRFYGDCHLIEGEIYFVVFGNADPQPEVNYQSLDLLIGPLNQIGASGVLWSDKGGPWELAAVDVNGKLTPGVFTTSPHLLTRVNGTSQGRAGCEVEGGKIIGAYQYGWPAGMEL